MHSRVVISRNINLHNMIELEKATFIDLKREAALRNVFRLYLSAIESGLVEAQLKVVQMHEKGRGTRQNIREAHRWHKLGAEKGSVQEIYDLTQFESFD